MRISKRRLMRIISEHESAARIMCGSMHPDQIADMQAQVKADARYLRACLRVLLDQLYDAINTSYLAGAAHDRRELAHSVRTILEDTTKPHWERINKALALLPPRHNP